MKKVVFFCLVISLLVLLVPATAFAEEPADSALEQVIPDDLQPWDEKLDIPDSYFNDFSVQDTSVISDNEANEPGSSALAVTPPPTVGPTKYTKSLKFDGYNAYYTSFTYTAPTTGLYYFADFDLSRSSGIIIYDAAGTRIAYDLTIFTPFSLLTPLKAGNKYTIYMECIGSKSLSYIMTTPMQMGDSAYTIKSNGYAYDWAQSFTFTTYTDQLYYLHMTCPTNCVYYFMVFDSNYESYYGWYYDKEVYDLYVYEPGTYHVVVWPTNYGSKTDTYTIAMDAEGNKSMANSIPVSTTLAANDTLTSNAFHADISGAYRFTCNRSDAILSVYDVKAANFIAQNVSANTTLQLVEGSNYAIFLTTNGTAGTMTYSATYLSPISTLSGITTSSSTLSPAFVSTTNSYTLNLDSAVVGSVTLTPVPTAAGAGIVIDGVAQASKTFPVTASTDQTVTIVSTAPNGATSSIYYVRLRALSRASAVVSASAPLGFDGHFITANVDNSTTSQAVSVGVSTNATWKLYSNAACTAELADKTVSLAEGLNVAYVKVTSEDNRNATVYPVFIYRASDTAAPRILAYNGSYSPISDGTLLSSNVILKLFGKATLTPSVTRNGVASVWPGDTFTSDGTYVVTLTDGNSATETFSFTIDKTAPAISASGAANGALTNTAVTVTVTDANLDTKTATKDGAAISWPSDNVFSADGAYAISARDKLGLTASYSFTIDRTGPAVLAICGGTTLSNNAYVKASVTATVSDIRFLSKSVTKNGAKMTWPRNNVFSTAAVYVITAADTAGNVVNFTFTIDKTMPKISAKAGRKSISNNRSANADVVLTITEANLASRTVTRDGAAYTWPANNTFTLEGKYVATVADYSGNTVNFTFTVDKPPVLTVTALTSGAVVANNANLNQGVHISLTDAFLKSTSLKKDNKTIAWPADGNVTADGVYTISVSDKYGNKVALKFTIDKTAPVITVKTKAKKVLTSGGATNEAYVTVTIADLTKYTKSVTRDGLAMSYPSSGKFSLEGVYVITATDIVGNVATFTFAIDKVAPVISCKTTGNTPVANGATVNQSVVISVTDRAAVNKTITYNGSAIAWPAGNTVTADGTYTVTATDVLGYAATPITFTIDKTGPAITATSSKGTVANNASVNQNVTVSISGNTSAPTVTKNGASYAYPSNGIFTEDGVYQISASDALGNATTLTFSLDKTAPVLSVKDFFDDEVQNDTFVTMAKTVTLSGADTKRVTLDGAEIDWADSFTAEGKYVLTAADNAGNEVSRTFTIDITMPVVTAVLTSDGTTLVLDTDVVTDAAGVTLSFEEDHLLSIYIMKDLEPYKKYPLVGEDEETLLWDGTTPLALTENGSYIVTITDKARNTYILVFTITVD